MLKFYKSTILLHNSSQAFAWKISTVSATILVPNSANQMQHNHCIKKVYMFTTTVKTKVDET